MNRGPRIVCVALSLMMVTACRRGDSSKRGERAAADLPPLAVPFPTASLPVTGFGDAVVALPAGATRARPVLVAVLGIGDTPEEQCATWRDVVGSRAFVLCPRGMKHMVPDEPAGEEPGAGATVAEATVPDAGGEANGEGPSGEAPTAVPARRAAAAVEDSPEEEKPSARPDAGRLHQVGFYPVDVPTLDREVTAGLAALKARYGAHVADTNVVYAGFSRGAFLGASLAMKHPDVLKRVVLIEGGHSPWQPEMVSSFARAGGQRVLFACGQPSCVDDAEMVATRLRAQKLDVRVVHGVGEGHGYRKQVKEELRRSFDWVTGGDPMWQPPR